jgi:GT2 family glycosyltransferase
MFELSVLLVNHNDRENLASCLASVQDNIAGLTAETIVVDNASSDSSREFLRGCFPWVELISNLENVGFSKANNQALSRSRGELILFLNTDTVLGPGTLAALLANVKGKKNIGCVAPALFNSRGVPQVSFGKKVGFFAELGKKSFSNAWRKRQLRRARRPREVGWLSAACLLAKREAVEDAGFFDEKFFLYFEDIDLCLRIGQKGWRLIYLPQARVLHKGGSSTGKQSLRSRYEYRRSQLRFYRKHCSRTSTFLLRLYLRLLFGFAFLLTRPGDSQSRKLKKQYLRLLTNEDAPWTE